MQKFTRAILRFSVLGLLLHCLPPVFITDAVAQGGYAGTLLRMGIASRSEAMGRAYTAVVGDPESAGYNPAASTAMHTRTVDLSLRVLPLDRTFAYVGFSTALRPHIQTAAGEKRALQGGLALSWLHAGVSNIEGRDFDGEKYGTFSNNQDAFNFTFALQIHPRVAVGMTAHIIWNRFPKLGDGEETVKSSALGLDLGTLVKVTDGLWLGAVYKNLNAKYTWNSDKIYERGTSTIDRFPKAWRVGVATNRIYQPLLLALDVEGSDVQDTKLFTGVDYQLLPQAHFRAGLRDGEPTFGAAYAFAVGQRQTTIHYAFVTQPNELASEHIFSWAFSF